MSIDFVVPGLVLVVVATVAGVIPWRLQPMATVKVLAGIAAIAALTVLAVLLAAVVGLAAQVPGVVSIVEWCGLFPQQHDVGFIEGAIAAAFAALVGVRITRVLRRWSFAVEGTQGRRFLILNTAEPIAYAAPGDPGCVVVSQGLLAALDPAERSVVLAHERAHLHLNHHRYLLAAELSVAVVPLLRPLVEQLRLATERSADESAAGAVDGNRRLVATTIAHAALMASSFGGTVGALGGASVPKRVEALLSPVGATSAAWRSTTTAVAVGAVMAVAGTAQAHHLVRVVSHLCQL